MNVYQDLELIKRNHHAVLTVGTFDGVHKGHLFILDGLKRRAQATGAHTTLVTFNPHPKQVLGKGDIKILTTLDEKLELLKGQALDNVVVIEFTRQFASTSSEQFVRNILFNHIGFSEIIIGYDHAFGRNREGGVQTLRRLAKILDFTVSELPELPTEEIRVNSTTIREFLNNGNVAGATKLLGRNYFMSGTVVAGDGRGKSLHYPTANISISEKEKLIPKNGVYAVRVHLRGKQLQGMMNIGYRPTFGTSSRTVEVHIFNFARDIYGQQMKVECVERIREEIHFSGNEELTQQLHKDKEKSIQILNNQEA